jgi:hypothetical protein
MDFEVHFCFSMQALQIALKLALVGPDGFAKSFVVLEYGSKTERQDGRMFETVSDHSGVVDSGFLIEGFGGVVFTDDNG